MLLSRFRHFSPVVAFSAVSAAVIACTMFPSHASAQTIFTDNFNTEIPGLTQTSLTNWTVTNTGATIDVIGDGSGFDFYPGNGRYIDLDGSTNLAAVLTTRTAFSLDAGSYTLSFDLGKNQSAPESMTVSVGSVFSRIITDSLNYPALVAQTFSFTVSSATTGAITFNHSGGDNSGYVIDNVSLVRQQVGTAAPEPGTLALLATLPATVGLLRCRRRK